MQEHASDPANILANVVGKSICVHSGHSLYELIRGYHWDFPALMLQYRNFWFTFQSDFEVIKRQFERFEGLLGHLLQGNNVNRNHAQAMDPTISANNRDVSILGGSYIWI